ncbi:MAG: Fe-Mn family superoxide dismutase [Acidiferrobacteraceae bacterium]
MPYALKPLACNPCQLSGLSEPLIISHYENNYSGAVKRLNKIAEQWAELDWASAPVFVINGLKREELIAYNSMVLHELYFDSLGSGVGPSGTLYAALARDFGSYERWHTQFAAMGKAQAGGSGWVLLTYSMRDNTLINQWAADHAHLLADAVPLLALDMYEHSYHLDYGAKAVAYVEAFMRNIRWENVMRLYERASTAQHFKERTITAGALKKHLADHTRTLLLDVRRRADYENDDRIIPGAVWCDPDLIQRWSQDLPKDQEIILYCVRGATVSNAVLDHLLKMGLNARYIEGGIEGWKTAGGEVRQK